MEENANSEGCQQTGILLKYMVVLVRARIFTLQL